MSSTGVKRKSKKEPKVSQRKIRRKEWFKTKQKHSQAPKISLEDLSESDFDSDDNLSVDDEEYGTLTDTEDESDDELEEVPEPDGVVTGEESEEDVKPKRPKSREPTEEDSRTVFVGNLPSTVTKNKLKRWFSKYGEVESVRLRCPPMADPSIPKKVAMIKKDFHEERTNIVAYVCFKNVETVEKALEANGAMFDNEHHIRVDLSTRQENFDPKKAVFIGNLPFGAEEEQLRDIFSECGDIKSIRIIRDKTTCVGKGFGYINFKERHSVQLAIEHDGVLLGKRELRVQRADYKSKKDKISQQKEKHSRRITQGKINTYDSKGKKKFKFTNNREKHKERKSFYQGELSKKKEKHKSKRKNKLQKKQEILRKILNTTK